MPISKRRPQILEVLNIAVSRFTTLRQSQCEILERPASVWLKKHIKPLNELGAVHSNKDEDTESNARNKHGKKAGVHFAIFQRKFYEYLLRVSLYSQRILEHKATRFCGFFIVLAAFALLSYEVSASVATSNDFPPAVTYVDLLITVCFLVEAICRVLGTLIRIKIEEAFDRKVNFMDMFLGSSFLDMIVIILCFVYGTSYVGLWLRFIRLLLPSASVMKIVPHVLFVLNNGITHGLRSISFTVLLLFMLILAWACMGNYFFSDNDPFHFGSYALSALTFFQLSTLENWSTVYYTNFSGCDAFPNEYSGGVDSPSDVVTIRTVFGTFNLPLCTTPQPQKAASTLIFFSFTICAAYVVVSMCLAAVAIGFNEYLEGLRSLQVYGSGATLGGSTSNPGEQLGAPMGMITARKQSGGRSGRVAVGVGKATHLLGKTQEVEAINALLVNIWGDVEEENKTLNPSDSKKTLKRDELHTGSKTQLALSQMARQKGIKRKVSSEHLPDEASSEAVKKFQRRMPQWMLKYLMPLMKDPYFLLKGKTRDVIWSTLVVVDAVVQIYEQSNPQGDSAGTLAVHAIVQVILAVDYVYRIVIQFREVTDWSVESLMDSFQWWNVVDLAGIIILVLATALHNTYVALFLRAYRILRFFSILRLASSLVSDLGVITLAVINSFVCLFYLAFLLLVYFVYYALAGVLFFQSSAPYYFKDIGTSIRTLMQVMTLDNWSDIMRKCMFGCKNYGFSDSGSDAYDASCDLSRYSGEGMGWWAAIYFVSFIVLSAMVLANLLVGVIISSMVALKEGYKEEEAIWARVRTLQEKYTLSEAQTSNMLTLFELLDRNANGFLTLEEVQPLLTQAKFPEAKQLELYLQVDADKSGQIDFSEFCELMMLVWTSKSAEFNQKNQVVLPSVGGRRSAVIVPRARLMSAQSVAGDIVGLLDTTGAPKELLEVDDEDEDSDEEDKNDDNNEAKSDEHGIGQCTPSQASAASRAPFVASREGSNLSNASGATSVAAREARMMLEKGASARVAHISSILTGHTPEQSTNDQRLTPINPI